MRNKLLTIFAAFALPLVFGWGTARAADPQNAGFKVVLADGSQVNGAISFVINLDTQYGQIKIPSANLVSAKFDEQEGWANIQLTDAQLKLKYKPASSDLKATTSTGPLDIALVNVARIGRGSVEMAHGSSSQAPFAAANSNAAPPPATSAPPQQPAVVQPPATVYQYPYSYAPPSSYYSPYYYSPYYSPYDYSPYYWGGGPYFGIGWPYFGFGFGFGHGYYGGFHGGGFHGGHR